MLGSTDCCESPCSNCPIVWQGQSQTKKGTSAVTLEAIADGRVWIRHVSLGMSVSCNVNNVFETSTLVRKMSLRTILSPLYYVIKGERKSKLYWVADGEYAMHSISVHTVTFPRTLEEKCLAACREMRKKVDRDIGVLQAMCHIVVQPARFWKVEKTALITRACHILNIAMVGERFTHDEELNVFYGIPVDSIVDDLNMNANMKSI